MFGRIIGTKTVKRVIRILWMVGWVESTQFLSNKE